MLLTLLTAAASLQAPLPPQAVRVIAGRAYVNCQWLQQNREDLSCRQTPDSISLADAYRPDVTFLVDTQGRATMKAASSQSRTVLFNPPRKSATLAGGFWLAARDLNSALGLPLRWQTGQLWLGKTPGAVQAAQQRTPEQAALAATRHQRGPVPGVGHSEGGVNVLLTARGSAEQQCEWIAHRVTCWTWQDGHWTLTWQAQTDRTPDDAWPQPRPDALEAVLGRVTPLSGTRPSWPGGLDFEQRGGSGTSRTVQRGWVAPGGQRTLAYEKVGLIDEAFAEAEFR
ncbi:hypothetical protein [Deinococcus radiodurans]|jgi:hypothetical protein|nr:hypothetical protein [Deinococcus radiodurans]ANC70836.1 hypothetical protein A2G07_03115 [Deinococcus radiodurans R1 = ATCC 13939 = DSM 20539]QIP27810.1 hypothetical protein HAV23_00135 [Deinococcus radiodurans]QIP31309.1 hypothetical protein HAV35_03380 [Deinococcus radiodurans]UID71064.1 hypothetical protein DRO_2071 [Deinococcus radiodurans R1 = ATCC 13939 = DSM 20539]